MATPDAPRPTFTTSSLPDVKRGDSIVAVCTDRHQVAAFLALKYLLSPIIPADNQVWHSCCDLRGQASLSYGSKNVIGAFDETVLVEINPTTLMRRVFWSVGGLAHAAMARGETRSSLVILVFGPTSLQQDILLDEPQPSRFGGQPQYCSTAQLKHIIRGNIDSMLITANMLGSGWVVNPALTRRGHPNNTEQLMELALPQNVPHAATLNVKHTQVLEDVLKASVDGGKERTEMKPLNRNLRSKFGKLHRTMRKCSSHDFKFPTPRERTLNLLPQHDDWPQLNGDRLGAPLHAYIYCWQLLPDAKVEEDVEAAFPYGCFGGTRESCLQHISLLLLVQCRGPYGVCYAKTEESRQELQLLHDMASSVQEHDDIEWVFRQVMSYSVHQYAANTTVPARAVSSNSESSAEMRNWSARELLEDPSVANAACAVVEELGWRPSSTVLMMAGRVNLMARDFAWQGSLVLGWVVEERRTSVLLLLLHFTTNKTTKNKVRRTTKTTRTTRAASHRDDDGSGNANGNLNGESNGAPSALRRRRLPRAPLRQRTRHVLPTSRRPRRQWSPCFRDDGRGGNSLQERERAAARGDSPEST
ncbi:hypothetical protein G7046_g4789 [Stylonectria norvegica]|nr:hypothetical protein G7046_g4789 [Stylonectria norvegica]